MGLNLSIQLFGLEPEEPTNNRHGVGAVAGVNRGTVRYVYALGRVNTIERNAGGLVGFNTGDIIASYADVDVTGKGSVGGLVGTNDVISLPVTLKVMYFSVKQMVVD